MSIIPREQDGSLQFMNDGLPTKYQIRHITIEPNIVLAPMVGVTDSIFRRMILSLGGCGLVCSEMTSASAVSPRARSRHELGEAEREYEDSQPTRAQPPSPARLSARRTPNRHATERQ